MLWGYTIVSGKVEKWFLFKRCNHFICLCLSLVRNVMLSGSQKCLYQGRIMTVVLYAYVCFFLWYVHLIREFWIGLSFFVIFRFKSWIGVIKIKTCNIDVYFASRFLYTPALLNVDLQRSWWRKTLVDYQCRWIQLIKRYFCTFNQGNWSKMNQVHFKGSYYNWVIRYYFLKCKSINAEVWNGETPLKSIPINCKWCIHFRNKEEHN